MKSCILVVAREAQARGALAQWLLGAGYAVELAESPRRALELTATLDIALAIVVPEGLGPAGLELVRDLSHETGDVIVVAEKAEIPGGRGESPVQPDGRTSTPFREPDVLAQVKSVLGAVPESTLPQPELLRFNRYSLDVGRRTCVDAEGCEVPLTRAEFALLGALARQPGRVLSREELTRAALDRESEAHDRSIDVLISRLRRKIEADQTTPRIILTVPGKGYELAAGVEGGDTTGRTTASSAREATSEATSAAGSVSRRLQAVGSFRLAMLGPIVIGLVGLAGLAALYWHPGSTMRTAGPSLSSQKFDPAAVPFVFDYVRTSLAAYEREPPAKAIAISREGWGVSSGAVNEEAAKSEALERCRDRDRTGLCRIYAVGDDVVWSKSTLALPLSADIRSGGPAPHPLTSESLNNVWQMIWHVPPPQNVVGYISGKEHKALAADFTSVYWSGGRPNQSEAIRIAIERCSDRGREPCLLLSTDGLWSVALPQSHRVTRPFTLAGETEMNDPERQRIAQIYSGKDWRALARGRSGHWYAVAEAQTEDAAAQQAIKMCQATEPECHLHALGNWRVEE